MFSTILLHYQPVWLKRAKYFKEKIIYKGQRKFNALFHPSITKSYMDNVCAFMTNFISGLKIPEEIHQQMSQLFSAQWECSHWKKELGFCSILLNMTTFPCTYFCYNVLLKNPQNTGFRIFSVLLTHFDKFA